MALPLSPRIVISASRRTDIPAFYMDWFFKQLNQGFFEVENPFNRRIRGIPATFDAVHTFVFWSKDFGPFLKRGCGERLLARGYHLFFNFSLNSEDRILEPNVPPLDQRLSQLAELCRRFGPQSVTWRFDPICVYQVPGMQRQDNLKDFYSIAHHAAKCGVTRCITSFLDIYAKVQRRAKRSGGIVFEDIPAKQKATISRRMGEELKPLGICLSSCCEKELVDEVADKTMLAAGSCIPNDLLMELYGGKLSLRADGGQRVKAGCGCKVSVDIGSYSWHPCHHNCLFCYANPACDAKEKKGRP